MFNKAIIAFSITVLFSSSVMAADAIAYNEPNPPEVVNPFSWTGGYIGFNLGYSWDRVKSDLVAIHPCTCDEYGFKSYLGGVSGGVQLGYNWQIDKALLGIESDIQAASLKKSFSTETPHINIDTKISWFGTTRIRAGYLPSERLLAYVTGGVAYGGVKATTSEYSFQGSPETSSTTKTGYAIGAGLEYAFTDNWSAKAEYLYADLGKISQRLFTYTDRVHHDITHKFQVNTVRVGVNYKF